jgi:hypothetical protein
VNPIYKTPSRTLVSLVIFSAFTGAMAQSGYRQIDLASNVPDLAANIDHRIVTPWGIAVSAGQPFRIANNGSGSFSSYDSSGAGQVFAGNIAGPGENTQPSRQPVLLRIQPACLSLGGALPVRFSLRRKTGRSQANMPTPVGTSCKPRSWQ